VGDSPDESAEWPDDDGTDWARLYILRPNLWSDYLDEIETALEAGRAQPADLVRFIERCLRAVRCLSDTHAQLPNLGLTLARFVELREDALAAELAALERDGAELGENETEFSRLYRLRQHPVEAGPLSKQLADFILNLSLRGLDDSRIVCALDIHHSWPELVRQRIRLHPGAPDVVAAHIAGKTLGQIAHETGVPASSVLRILKLIGERPHGVTARTNARDRARTIVKLRDRGLTYKEIADRLDCSLDTVRNALRRDRVHRYRSRQ
jgi:hypothetical protein